MRIVTGRVTLSSHLSDAETFYRLLEKWTGPKKFPDLLEVKRLIGKLPKPQRERLSVFHHAIHFGLAQKAALGRGEGNVDD